MAWSLKLRRAEYGYTSYTGVAAKVDSCFGLAAGCRRTRPFPVGYTDDGIWVSLLDGMAATLLFALSAYWAWYVLGFVHISITTLFITILGISCTLVGSFFIRWILEFINHAVYTPFISHFLSASVMWPYCGASSCYGIVCNLLRASVRRWKINW